MSDYGLPKYCPIDGSRLEPPNKHDEDDDIYACEECSHNWVIHFEKDSMWYTLELTGY